MKKAIVNRMVNSMDDFGFLKALKNAPKLKEMFQRAGELREQMEQIKEELAVKTVEGDAGAGAVKVVMNGKMQVVQVRLDQPLLSALAGDGSDMDRQMVEELIAAAVNAAGARARELINEEMKRAMGGMDIPGLNQLLDGS